MQANTFGSQAEWIKPFQLELQVSWEGLTACRNICKGIANHLRNWTVCSQAQPRQREGWEGCSGDCYLGTKSSWALEAQTSEKGVQAQLRIRLFLLCDVWPPHFVGYWYPNRLIKWAIAFSGLLKFSYWYGLHCRYAQWKQSAPKI